MDNDDLRDFLLRHRKIMSDTELAREIGCTPQALGRFITRSERTHGNHFRVATLHQALGLEPESRVVRTWKPKEEI